MKHKRLVVLSLVLLELALCVGMYSIVRATVTTFSALGIRFGATPSATAEAQEEYRFAVNGPATLTVDNRFGAVRIAAGPSDEITISAHKQIWGQTPADAQIALAALELQTTKEGNAVRVQPTSVPPTNFSFSVLRPAVDITITVPVTTAVSSNVLFGGISLSGINGDAELTSNRNSIRVNDVIGNLKLQSDSGDITAERVRGQIHITSNRGSLRLKDIRADGELVAKTDTGEILLQDCAASSLVVQIVRGKATLDGCTVQSAKMSTGTGDLALSQVQADLLHLQTRRGNIGVDGITRALWARIDAGNVAIANGDHATLDVQTMRGSISYAGSLGVGPNELQSDNGDIRLSLPKEAALTLDLQTNHGQISSQFDVAMVPGSGKDYWRGTINGGGVALKASTRNANIVLNLLDQ